MLEQLPFKIFKRTLKSGKQVYYVRFLLPDNSYTSGRSTGESSKRKAELKAWEYLKTGNPTAGNNPTVEKFSKNFFDWDNDWALSKRSSGKRISVENCRKNNRLVENHIVRLLGKKKLSELDTATCRQLRNKLFKEGKSGSLTNQVLGCLKAICEAAEEKHYLRGMPRIERAALNQKETGILSTEQVTALFSLEWNDYRAYVCNLIAASTGFRLGEILGIKFKNIDLKTGQIIITGSWNSKYNHYKEGTKKGQSSRSVPIPQSIQESIERLINANPYPYDPENYLFYAEVKIGQPMQDRIAVQGFKKALLDIGIDEEKRKLLNLKFHSHRHFFNSLLIESRIPLQKIQRLTGHLSPSMTERYYHTSDLSDVGQVTKDLFKKVIFFKQGA